MRNAIVLGLAVTSSACSHAVAGSDSAPSPSPSAAVAANTAGAPAAKAAVPVEAIYRVPLEGLPSLGDARAPVTIVAFTDYQCPFCRRADATIAQIRASYGDQVRIVVAEKPLPMHDRARPAAIAALAASAKGRSRRCTRASSRGSLDEASIVSAAKEIGLDVDRFNADRAGTAATSRAGRGARRQVRRPRHTVVLHQRSARRRRAADREVSRGDRRAPRRGARAHRYRRATRGRLCADRRGRRRESRRAGGRRWPGCGGGECNGPPDGKDAPQVGDKVEIVPIDRAPRAARPGRPSRSSSSPTTSARSARARRRTSTPSSRRTPAT